MTISLRSFLIMLNFINLCIVYIFDILFLRTRGCCIATVLFSDWTGIDLILWILHILIKLFTRFIMYYTSISCCRYAPSILSQIKINYIYEPMLLIHYLWKLETSHLHFPSYYNVQFFSIEVFMSIIILIHILICPFTGQNYVTWLGDYCKLISITVCSCMSLHLQVLLIIVSLYLLNIILVLLKFAVFVFSEYVFLQLFNIYLMIIVTIWLFIWYIWGGCRSANYNLSSALLVLLL